jgi:sec-independent protein translocase protein TatC
MLIDQKVDLVEHLGELRRRVMWVAAVLVLGMAGGIAVAKPAILFMQSVPPASGMSWHAFSPWDNLRLYLSFAFVIGFLVTLPVLLYHVWAFVSPGLRNRERKSALLYLPFAVLLYLGGLAFGLMVVFPFAFKFSTSLGASLNIEETFGAAQYFSFMFNIIIPLSLIFELPIVVMFLTKLRILNPTLLVKFRKISYMILVVLAAFITPPDAISMILVFIPMILLYEFSVYLSRFVYRKQLILDQERERAFDAEQM